MHRVVDLELRGLGFRVEGSGKKPEINKIFSAFSSPRTHALP